MVNRLPVPGLLGELIGRGEWVHPGDDVLRRAFPLLTDPLDFLPSVDGVPIVAFQGWPPASQAWACLRMYVEGEERPLPWLDARSAVFVALNRIPGDDVAIALDFRRRVDRPRVVASRWLDAEAAWFVLAEDFERFWQCIRRPTHAPEPDRTRRSR